MGNFYLPLECAALKCWSKYATVSPFSELAKLFLVALILVILFCLVDFCRNFLTIYAAPFSISIVKILNLLYHAFMYSLLILLSSIYPFTQCHLLLVTIVCYQDFNWNYFYSFFSCSQSCNLKNSH